jgi:transposase-like protein
MNSGTRISRDRKASIARGLEESGLTMATYAAMHGVSERTLRNWVAIFAQADPGLEAKRIVERAIQELSSLLTTLASSPANTSEPDKVRTPTPIPSKSPVTEWSF